MNTRDITMDEKGVQLIITVQMPDRDRGKPARRFGVRVHGSKQEIDEILDAGILQDIDRKIAGGALRFTEGDEIPFDVPTPAGGQG